MACKFTTTVSTLIIGASLAGSGSVTATLPTGGAPSIFAISAAQTGATTGTMGYTSSEDATGWTGFALANAGAPSIATLKNGNSVAPYSKYTRYPCICRPVCADRLQSLCIR